MVQSIKSIVRKTNKINTYLLIKLCCIVIAAFVVAGFSSFNVEAASGLKLYNNTTKKTTNYTDKQVTVTYNNKTISKSDTPGILIDGVAVLPVYEVFRDSEIKADCVYDSKKRTVTVSKNGTTIRMTLGKKAATVNGKAVTLPVAPVLIKYIATNKWKVLVPSRYIAETLGYGYTWLSEKSIVAIEKYAMQLSYNNGNKFEYVGVQGKVTIDGKNVELEGMPSIIKNNTALLQAKTVFADSAIAANYSYDKNNKTVTITKNNNVIVMTIGSTKAFVNNKSKTLDTAPILVKNYDTNSEYIMVPGSFTTTSLGYNYTWNNSTRTSAIVCSKSNSESPELGDSGVVNETGTILYEWKANETTYKNYSEIHSIETDGSLTNIGNIYLASRDYENMKQNAETFMIVSTAPFGKVSASNNGNMIDIQAGNVTCNDQIYQLYGLTSNYVNTIGTYHNLDNISTTIQLNVIASSYLYDISLSPDRMILYVTVYQNTVTSAVIGKNSTGDYLTLTGINPLKVNLTEQTGILSVEIPSTVNGVNDINSTIIGAEFMTQINTINSTDKTFIILTLTDGYEYYTMESGNQYTISLQASGDEQSEDTSNTEDIEDTYDDGNPFDTLVAPPIPTVSDVSKYEIVIPRPADLDLTAITNEDYYFDHYFVIKLKGDYKAFFDENIITQQSKVVDKITVSVTGSNITMIKIATNKLQGYELAVDDNNLYINIGDPKDIYKNIVVLDPGHGGAAKGAQYYGTCEKDVNFKILFTIGKKYFNNDTSKLKVYYTRTSDVDMTLSNRAAFVKLVGADLFVSLHMNAAVSAPNVNGSEVFYSKKNNSANSAGLTSEMLASFLVNNLVKTLGTSNRGVKQESYTVIYKNTVPAVLIELGFLSTKSDYAKLTNEDFQENTANTIYQTLLEVFEDYPTGR